MCGLQSTRWRLRRLEQGEVAMKAPLPLSMEHHLVPWIHCCIVMRGFCWQGDAVMKAPEPPAEEWEEVHIEDLVEEVHTAVEKKI
jgi:hypothetical protein